MPRHKTIRMPPTWERSDALTPSDQVREFTIPVDGNLVSIEHLAGTGEISDGHFLADDPVSLHQMTVKNTHRGASSGP